MAMLGRSSVPSLDAATEWLQGEPLGAAEVQGHVVLMNFGCSPASPGYVMRGEPLEKCIERDDVVHLHRHPDLVGQAGRVAEVLALKCAHAGIDVPTRETMRATPFRGEIETGIRTVAIQ